MVLPLISDTVSERVGLLLRQVAAHVVLPRFGALRDHEHWEKTPGEIVTIVDREAEEFVARELVRIIPGSRVIGEEAVASSSRLLEGLNQGTVWLVDPLDGTANFAAGEPRFALMVALLRDGETLASWMLDPIGDRLAYATLGAGAFINAEPIRTSAAAPMLSDMRGAVLTGFLPSALHELIQQGYPRIREVLPGMRCAGHEYPAIARGDQHFALFWRTLPWDHVPGVLFLTQAGGCAARLNGQPYRASDVGSGLLLAQNEAIWQSVRDCLLGSVPGELLHALCK